MLNEVFCLASLHMTPDLKSLLTVQSAAAEIFFFFFLFFLFSFLSPAPLTVYVWQQHVCAAARRGCDGVWGGEGDRGGE